MIKTAKVVGLNSDTDAALALSSVGLFAIVASSLEDAFARVRQALFEAESFFTSSDLNISQKITETAEIIKKSLEGADNIQILLTVIEEDEQGTAMYLLYQGDSLKAYLIRHGKRSDLIAVADGEVISGLLEDEDRVVLSTDSLINFLSEDLDILGSTPIDVLEDEINLRLPEAQTYPVAALILEKDPSTLRPFDHAQDKQAQDAEQEDAEEDGDHIIFTNNLSFKMPNLAFLKEVFFKIIPKSLKGKAILVGVVAVLILIIVGINTKNKNEASINQNFSNYLKTAQESWNKAQSLTDDQNLAISSLKQAQDSLEHALKIKPKNSEGLDLKKQIENNKGGILKIYKISDLPLWLDLNLIKPDFQADRLSSSLGILLVLDTKKKNLVSINLQTKAQQVLAGEDKLGEAQLASLNGNNVWVYSDKGLIKTGLKDTTLSVVIKPDKDWKKITDILGFANNIYILDQDQIWKYVPIEKGYSDKFIYFKSGVKVDLSDVVKMQIDSSVWFLKKNGDILKYTQGASDYFSISGLDKNFNNPRSFFALDSVDNIYVLDSGNSRIVVLDKKGIYKAQYQGDKLGTVDDLVVDEENKKIYLLAGSKIYSIELK
ncbi:MAG: hypothetical protein Q7R97_01395 [Candidatus Daviesbacteria bacterium]|nr:hypothetical protein [Candidatus Daviesbacteria bacterium]